MYTQTLWVFKTYCRNSKCLGTQYCGYLKKYGYAKFRTQAIAGMQNVGTKIGGYSKVVGIQNMLQEFEQSICEFVLTSGPQYTTSGGLA